MRFRVRKADGGGGHHSDILSQRKLWFHYNSLFQFDSAEFFEDEAVAYRPYLCWLDQEPNLSRLSFLS